MLKLSLRRKRSRTRSIRTPYRIKIRSIPIDATTKQMDDLPLDIFTSIARWSGGPLLEIFPANYIFDTDE